MSFVRWHYRNGTYVCSHYRRAPRSAARDQSPPLFVLSTPGSDRTAVGAITAGATVRVPRHRRGSMAVA